MVRLIAVLAALTALLAPSGFAGRSYAQGPAPIESELNLITPVSKFIHDAALKAPAARKVARLPQPGTHTREERGAHPRRLGDGGAEHLDV